jgi:hypothetical protein
MHIYMFLAVVIVCAVHRHMTSGLPTLNPEKHGTKVCDDPEAFNQPP